MRKSGILLHIASLPNDYGIGSMGREAYDFVDYLKKSGQSIWQILPLSQTSYGDSPYQLSHYTPGTLISSALTCLPRKVC